MSSYRTHLRIKQVSPCTSETLLQFVTIDNKDTKEKQTNNR